MAETDMAKKEAIDKLKEFLAKAREQEDVLFRPLIVMGGDNTFKEIITEARRGAKAKPKLEKKMKEIEEEIKESDFWAKALPYLEALEQAIVQSKDMVT
jgi:hypothetical protein